MTDIRLQDFLDDFFIDHSDDSLSHDYDAAKAREYYLRTRKLKGRKPGSKTTPSSSSSSKSSAAKRAAEARAKKIRAAKIKAAAEKRVFELKVRLKRLETALDALTKQAKARSGVDPKTSVQEKAKADAAAKNRKPLTAAQKREAAKKAAERREKESDQSLSAQEKTLETKIEKVRDRIENMKVEMAAAKRKVSV